LDEAISSSAALERPVLAQKILHFADEPPALEGLLLGFG
jgi:hypothetical protein